IGLVASMIGSAPIGKLHDVTAGEPEVEAFAVVVPRSAASVGLRPKPTNAVGVVAIAVGLPKRSWTWTPNGISWLASTLVGGAGAKASCAGTSATTVKLTSGALNDAPSAACSV